MTAPPVPVKGVTVIIPVLGSPLDGGDNLGPVLEALTRKGQRLEDLPPRFDQVEVGGVFGLEHEFPSRMADHEEQDVRAAMRIQVVQNRNDVLASIWDRSIHPVEE